MDFDGVVFAPGHSRHLGEPVARRLGVELAPLEEREFDGGEHKSRSLVEVRDRSTFVIASLAGDDTLSANDKLCRLLFLVGALHEAAARSVTAVVPYLCYARKDRQTKARDPVTTRYVAQLLEAVGTDRVATVDVHDLAAFQNAYRCPTDHLEAALPFTEHVHALAGGRPVTVVSPDIGGVKRATRFQELLAERAAEPVELAFTEKHRSRGVVTGGDAVVGEVEGRVAVVYDDLISTGGTMARVADALARQGADEVHLVATHAVFGPGAEALFDHPAVTSVVVSDSVAPGRIDGARVGDRLTVVTLAGLLAEAIVRIGTGGSLSELLRLEE